MIAYWLIWVILIGLLFWGIWKLLNKLVFRPTPRNKTVEEKMEELDALEHKRGDLTQEVEVTEKLGDVDSEIDELKDRLEDAETNRS